MNKAQFIKATEVALEGFDDRTDSDNKAIWQELFEASVDLFDLQGAEHYVEPGYDTPEGLPILFADWNPPEAAKFGELSEKVGCEIEWSDEWSTCDDCSGAFRTSPDCYSWTQYAVFLYDGYTCGDCVKNDPPAYLQAIANDARQAITIDGVNPTEHGYSKVNDESFEYGFHHGQDNSPDAILNSLRKAGVAGTAVFNIDESSQFYMRFSVYVETEFLQDAQNALEEGNTRCDVSPAVALEQGLKQAARDTTPPEEGKVQVVTVDTGTGTATVRNLSADEFISGNR